MTREFTPRTRIDCPAQELFAWHARPGALERLSPPWERAELIERTGGIEEGARVVLRIRLGPFRMLWIAEHRECDPPRSFRDVQVRGPFKLWDHTHCLVPDGPGACFLEDRLRYELPFGRLGDLIAGRSVRRRLERLFAYRHRVTADDLAAHRSSGGGKTMKILVSGASGLVGSALVPFLTSGGHEVVALVRRVPRESAGEIRWDPAAGELDPKSIEGFDAVVHLAGESIASGRWSVARKKRIAESRAKGTRLLAETIANLDGPPSVFVSASAIGFYGNRGEEELDEGSELGKGFLAEVCRDWEAATEPARAAGIRTARLRFGVILSPGGGALAKMLIPFKLGVGGVIGDGRQYMSWVALDDVVGAIHHALTNESVAGAVNVVAPAAATNREFTRTLGRVLGRPTIFPLPAFVARIALGEMAEELLLASTRVGPGKLTETGYDFRHPELEGALRHLLGKT